MIENDDFQDPPLTPRLITQYLNNELIGYAMKAKQLERINVELSYLERVNGFNKWKI